MPRKILPVILILCAAVALVVWYVRRDGGARYFTGFVEGEERIIRSEVSGRLLEMRFREGDSVPAEAVIAVLDAGDIEARLQSKRGEVAVLDAELSTQEERIALIESTWARDVRTRNAELRQAETAATLAQRTLQREQELVETGASTAQLLDDTRAQRDHATSALERARQVLARTEAEERQITLARSERDALRQRRALAVAQLAELEVTHAKYTVRAPRSTTLVQTQFLWPGELAQPGTALLALLDPADKYVQFYVPVSDLDGLKVGRRVAIELDSTPGQRIPGEVSFIADRANFTPEKIETRSDRVGQVYRVKVRVLDGVEGLQPGTEGNVYLEP